jgi:hypothetical protein
MNAPRVQDFVVKCGHYCYAEKGLLGTPDDVVGSTG